MKSLLYQGSVFSEPPGCAALPCRIEVKLALRKNNRIFRFVLRDKLLPEDPYLVMVKAIAFAIQNNEPYAGKEPDRSIKDFLIKNSVVI